ncbi:thermonuclease family protein [Pannus brasiliensis CCIBt3594]|uniref:Thermonuclease family protein n=1 Tax=Pannus brasiliensis CCIBt3594 TaxID=1427578 RepID=A0AAW9R278_9CHRO
MKVNRFLLLAPILLGVFFIGLRSNSKTNIPETTVSIESCHDGDTCRSTTGERIRFACIDAPELKQAYGEASRDYLRSILKNQPVRIDRMNVDRYGRTIAILYIPDGKEWRAVQWLQTRAGTVWAFDRFKKDCPIWNSIERKANEARSKRIGLFSDGQAIEPWEWRKRNR